MKKIEEKIRRTTEKLEEIRAEYNKKSKLLEDLIAKRAKISADFVVDQDPKIKQGIIKLTKEIDEIRIDIQDQPELFIALEEKIEELKKENAKEDLEVNIKKQKELAKKIEEASDAFLLSLDDAIAQNANLGEFWEQYHQVAKATNKHGFFKRPTTWGSKQSLASLRGVIKAEMDGHPRLNDIFRGVFI